jgi:endonuclease/exonuclease/phosphatase family metal-dependent hydrolase
MARSGHSSAIRGVCALLVALTCACSSGAGSDDDTSARRATVRIVSQNLLHGIACAPDSDRCDLPARVELFAGQVGRAGCPDVVAVQEANDRTVELLRPSIAGVCNGRYRVVWDDDAGLDRELVLTTRPVLGVERVRLAGPLRTALHLRIAATVGVVDVVTTHLASSSDDRPCDDASCPAPCHANDTLQTCQAREVAAFARRVGAPDGVTLVAGDFNAEARETTIEAVRAAGFTDTHLAAGNEECDRSTGAECTSGRVDDALTDLRDAGSRQTERIDYVFSRARGGRECRIVAPTGLFNARADGRGRDGIVFPADHTGVQATLQCSTTAAQRDAATRQTLPATTTTLPPTGGGANDADVAAITDAFRAVFDGDVTDVDRKLASLEDGELLRASFVESYEKTRAVASRVRVRLDEVRLLGADRADVVYTLLLDGNAVLDHLPGAAVRAGARWLVTRRTYCEVATQGQTAIPEPCRSR